MVAVGIVDGFEAIEIDLQQGDRGCGAAGALDGAGQAVLEEASVGESGQVVVQGKILCFFNLLFE